MGAALRVSVQITCWDSLYQPTSEDIISTTRKDRNPSPRPVRFLLIPLRTPPLPLGVGGGPY